MTDLELLHDFANRGSQSAFATLVARHLDLVYSAARRQVRSPQLAEEIAQSVFIDLARHPRLKPGAPLVAWLFLVTRRTAIDALRRESTRRAQETAAAEIACGELAESAAMKSDPTPWPQIEPLLDEAIATLNDADRTAVLLRFFANKSLREVGESLGGSENAAQKRVTRALDQLRAFFLRRGVTVTAAGLATDLSAHALLTAPVGLGATISATATTWTAAGVSAVAKTAETLAMTSLQKSCLAVAFTTVVGVCLFEAQAIADQSRQLDLAQKQHAGLLAEVSSLRGRRTAAMRAPASRSGSVALPAEMDSELQAWLNRVTELKTALAQLPEQNIPEIQLLPENIWLNLAKEAGLTTGESLDATFKHVRHSAKSVLALRMSEALQKHLAASGGVPLTDLSQLTPWFDPPLDPAILRRYEIIAPGPNDSTAGFVVGEKLPVRAGDKRIFVNAHEYSDDEELLEKAIDRAGEAIATARGGVMPTSFTPDDFLPHLSPTDRASFLRLMERKKQEALREMTPVKP